MPATCVYPKCSERVTSDPKARHGYLCDRHRRLDEKKRTEPADPESDEPAED